MDNPYEVNWPHTTTTYEDQFRHEQMMIPSSVACLCGKCPPNDYFPRKKKKLRKQTVDVRSDILEKSCPCAEGFSDSGLSNLLLLILIVVLCALTYALVDLRKQVSALIPATSLR